MNQKIEIHTSKISNKTFWIIGAAICIVVIAILAHDITRPFTGLHSWGEAHRSWFARNHVEYGLGYTKGLCTWAVGYPPTDTPRRYVDHPQLRFLVHAAFMKVFGVNQVSIRIEVILMTVVSVLLLLKIVRSLTNEVAALLTALIFAVFPINGYFGVGEWVFPIGLMAMWFYLVEIGGLKEPCRPSKWNKWLLAISLFFALMFSWEGFFVALGIGVHYLAGCVFKRRWPKAGLLLILMIAPMAALIINFSVMMKAQGWGFDRILELYKWRASEGEEVSFQWGLWFERLWSFAILNFGWAVMILTIGYFSLGQMLLLRPKEKLKKPKAIKLIENSRRFPQFWLFLLPGVFQLFLLKGTLWKHHYWERPLCPFFALAAALAILIIADLFGKIKPIMSKAVVLILAAVVIVNCSFGIHHYYGIHHFSSGRVKMFSDLNKKLAPDQELLSFESMTVNQNAAKGEHYRPEVAWYLNRKVKEVKGLKELLELAKTGKYPCYLMPAFFYDRKTSEYLREMSKHLTQLYKFQYIKTTDNEPGLPYLVFDLASRVPAEQ